MQIEKMPTDVAAILSCACTGCAFIRQTWKNPAPGIVQSLDAIVGLSDPDEIERASQALFADTDLRALDEAIRSCPCVACTEFKRVMSAPDHGEVELQTMMAAIKAEPDAPERIGEFLRAYSKDKE